MADPLTEPFRRFSLAWEAARGAGEDDDGLQWEFVQYFSEDAAKRNAGYPVARSAAAGAAKL